MSTTIFKSKQLSPTRQALADAIQNLRVLEIQHDMLATSLQYGGAAFNAVLSSQDAIDQAEQALKDAQRAHVAEMAGGSATTLIPRQARDAIEHAKQDHADAEQARNQIKDQIASLSSQISIARIRRDSCVTAVLSEHYAPTVAALTAEIAALQHQLVAKAQLLYEMAGSIVPRTVTQALPQSMERVEGTAPAWQMPTTPAPLLVRYRSSAAALKSDAATPLEN